MGIEHLLAVVPVSDIDVARDWYTRLFGREPTNTPMESLVEWQVTDTGWLQVTRDADRAGTGLVNLAVDDLTTHREAVIGRGLAPADIQEVTKGVQLSAVVDPDGNTITLIGRFRPVY